MKLTLKSAFMIAIKIINRNDRNIILFWLFYDFAIFIKNHHDIFSFKHHSSSSFIGNIIEDGFLRNDPLINAPLSVHPTMIGLCEEFKI